MAISNPCVLFCLKNVRNFLKSNVFRFYSKPEFILQKSLKLISLELNVRSSRTLYTASPLLKKARVEITFIKNDGSKLIGKGEEGESLLDVVVNNNLDLGGFGACEGTLSCSTCHVIFKPEDFEKLPFAIDEELDMLDTAPEVCPTSRLGCEVTVTKDMEGLVVSVPAIVRDARGSPTGTDETKN